MAVILHKFEGNEVIASKVAIKNAGDGLSKALAVEPVELPMFDEVFIVIRCAVGQVHFKPVTDTKSLVRTQDLIAGTATLIDKSLVIDLLQAQQDKIDEMEGKTKLDFAEGAGEGDGDGEGE